MNKDVIYLPEEAIKKAATEFETPFFLYEEKRIRDNARRFADAFKRHFPDFWPTYAVKANCNPEVLKILIDEGFDMDASSEAEAWLSKKLGVGGMYTGNFTTAETLKYAKDRGFILNLDDLSMVPFLEEIGVPEMISFRINPGVGKSTMKDNVFAGEDAKYGVPHEKAVEAYRAAREAGVKRFGIHMMTGSNVPIEEQDYFSNIVAKLFDVVAEIKKETGIEIELMNIGGGFGVPYEPDRESLDIIKVANGIKEVFDAKCKEHDLKPPRMMAEPGRYISCDAGWLVGRVTVIKDSYKKFVGIDASTNDMPRPAFYGAYHYVTVLNDSDEEESYSVVGTICENNDQFAKSRRLPVASVGDIVAIHNCGAHARVMGHNYNSKLRHAEYLLGTDGSLSLIRRGETIEDLFKHTDL